MENKTVVITGANSGIGKSTAIAIAKMGAKIIMICRNESKGMDAMAEIKTTSGNEEIHLLIADFSVQRDIRRVAEDVSLICDQIDVLVNNAGLIMGKKGLTIDGLETTFAVNHLGYFLLTHLLLDLVKASPAGRIVCVSSEAHRIVREVNFSNLQAEESFSGWNAYGLSKLGNIYFSFELAKRLKEEGSNVTVNCLHPGTVGTNFGKSSGGWLLGNLMKIGGRFLIKPEKGAATSVYLATSPDVEGKTAGYYERKKIRKSSRVSRDMDIAYRFWTVSEELCGIV